MTKMSSSLRRCRLAGRVPAQHGTTLVEVLVTIIILMVGLLGLVGLMVQSQRGQVESYQRVQALVIMQDMVNRINTNRKAAACYSISSATAAGTGFLGTPGTGAGAVPGSCADVTAEQQATVIRDMTEWNSLLLGSAETLGGSSTGAMIGARGCVHQVDTAASGVVEVVYRVTVTWQGQGATAAPPAVNASAPRQGVACGRGLYDPTTATDLMRRAVYQDVQIVNLLGT